MQKTRLNASKLHRLILSIFLFQAIMAPVFFHPCGSVALASDLYFGASEFRHTGRKPVSRGLSFRSKHFLVPGYHGASILPPLWVSGARFRPLFRCFRIPTYRKKASFSGTFIRPNRSFDHGISSVTV